MNTWSRFWRHHSKIDFLFGPKLLQVKLILYKMNAVFCRCLRFPLSSVLPLLSPTARSPWPPPVPSPPSQYLASWRESGATTATSSASSLRWGSSPTSPTFSPRLTAVLSSCCGQTHRTLPRQNTRHFQHSTPLQHKIQLLECQSDLSQGRAVTAWGAGLQTWSSHQPGTAVFFCAQTSNKASGKVDPINFVKGLLKLMAKLTGLFSLMWLGPIAHLF